MHMFFDGYPVSDAFESKLMITFITIFFALFLLFIIILAVGITRMKHQLPLLRSKRQHKKAMVALIDSWKLNETENKIELPYREEALNAISKYQTISVFFGSESTTAKLSLLEAGAISIFTLSEWAKLLYQYCDETTKKYGYKIPNYKALTIALFVVPSMVLTLFYVSLFINGHQIKEEYAMRCDITRKQIYNDLSGHFDHSSLEMSSYSNTYSGDTVAEETLDVTLVINGDIYEIKYTVETPKNLTWDEKIKAVETSFNRLFEQAKNITVPSATNILKVSPFNEGYFDEILDEYKDNNKYDFYYPSPGIQVYVCHDVNYYNEEFSISIKSNQSHTE